MMDSSRAEAVQFAAELWYAPVLLFVFMLSAACHSILVSKDQEDEVACVATGPGGRPLPSTKRKRASARRPPAVDGDFSKLVRRVFDYLTCFVVLTFLANAVAITARTLGGANEGG